jgi:hypothetical protein
MRLLVLGNRIARQRFYLLGRRFTHWAGDSIVGQGRWFFAISLARR